MADDHALRDHLVYLLEGGGAHRDVDYVLNSIPAAVRGTRPDGLPHSPWELLEHLRISQWDILEFSRNPDHVSPEWPDGYWPAEAAPSSAATWEASLGALQGELAEMIGLVRDGGRDLYAPFPWGEGQTLLREALLVADHNAYHLGQLVTVRQLLGVWPPE
ncbi:DinB family protein [Gemmatimonadota bacterium]